jgi:hypothetical protein
MPSGTVQETIAAPCQAVFNLLHDYDRRLEWDTLLQEAYLVDGHDKAQVGAVSVCTGRPHLGGLSLKTEYITFQPPMLAAVKLVNRPALFDSFAASIHHREVSESESTVDYKYNFTARPAFLRFVLHPVMNTVLAFETRKRLRALKQHFAHIE